MRLRPISFLGLTFMMYIAVGTVAADDGEQTLKRMTGGNIDNQLTVLPADIGLSVSETEHAFTDYMKFYVPSQAASGLVGALIYNDVDLNYVEELAVAKPLVNVFIYGPAIEPPGTAFLHSWMDTFAAVSLDDGVTWKTTNLSQSADQSSFNIETDHNPSNQDPLPGDHNIRLGNAMHARGYETPYTAACTECHGQGLQGVAQVPSCYSCHNNNWDEPTPVDIGPIIYMAEFQREDKTGKSKLKIEGENAAAGAVVTIANAITEEAIGTTEAKKDGGFAFDLKYDANELPPCVVVAEYTGNGGEVFTGPTLTVIDKQSGLPVEECEGSTVNLADYPGGVFNVFQATDANKVLVAWPSRFCQQGQPAYSIAWDGDDEGLTEEQLAKRAAVATLLGVDITKDLYLTDLFGVAGSQGSIDFTDEGYPQAGVVPFACVWTARGVLLPGDDPRTEDVVESSHMVWTKPERLTSGRRDPNRIEVQAVKGAGFVITWQEDPDGLRPGQGEGPGEGWSGAVAHSKTDVWYSFIRWEDFDLVEAYDENGDPTPTVSANIADHDLLDSGRPQVFVPMAVPMRLTNNDKCQPEYYGPDVNLDSTDKKYFSYCNYDVAAAYGLQDFCADTASVPQGQAGAFGDICVNAEGLPNIANTASTRPRLSLQGYDSDGDTLVDSAWVILAAEESKGLGRFGFLPDGTPCDEDDDAASPDCSADVGKNQWYFSFDMGRPDTSAEGYVDHENGLVQNLVKQGNLLNQPEVDWRTGEFYPVINTSEMWDFGDYNFDLYNTEIARRSSLLVQGIGKAVGSDSGLTALLSWKQGAMNQGGPADTMFRRILLPDDYTDGIVNNPYAFANMACDNWLIGAGENPYYPGGVCGEPATNLSSVVPDTCIDTSTGESITCPTVTFDGTNCTGGTTHDFGCGDTNPILQGYLQGEGNTQKVLTWHQCPGASGNALDTSELEGAYFDCDTDARTDAFVNLKDQSWYNPLDVSKGHRGFLDGDFVMFLYAWSPNWRLNAKGNDRYDLYVRRSFDGGVTWQTTPSSFLASNGESYSGDGTVTCETYRSLATGEGGGTVEPHVCYEYAAGANEQARNVTQHSRMKITTLDPRFAISGSPRGVSITDTCLDALGDAIDTSMWTCDDTSAVQDTDLRNPSRYFMVYEVGDNSTVEAGEAEPLDLFYSRAENFGDDYVVWTEADTGYDNPDDVCYPTVAHDDEKVIGTVVEGSGFCNEFDKMNSGGDTHSSEASLEANPAADKMYGVWSQWVYQDDDYDGEIIESDAKARRVWWIDNYRSTNEDLIWTLPGTQQPAQ